VNLSRLVPFLLIFALVLASGPGALGAPPKPGAAATPKPGAEGEFPLHITAAHLEADQKEGIVIFSGKVKAEYGDATLYADQLQVYFQKNPEAPAAAPARATPPAKAPAAQAGAPSPLESLGSQKIDRIVARGQVRLVQEDRVASGQEAIYYQDRDEVVLTGNPQLWRAENTLKGERIVFNLKTNRVVVESSPQKRVEAVLYSQGTQGTPGGKKKPPAAPGSRKGRRP
jgi:lipopolysaccharide export system protein LptA